MTRHYCCPRSDLYKDEYHLRVQLCARIVCAIFFVNFIYLVLGEWRNYGSLHAGKT